MSPQSSINLASGGRKGTIGSCAVLISAMVVLALTATPAPGFSSWSIETDPTGFTHFTNNPNDFPAWDKSVITWKFETTGTDSFTGTWGDVRVQNQVRLAFQQWQNAFNTPPGTTYSYNRASGWQPFGDIRSIAVHELGHVLGMHHPDQAAAVNRNFRPGPGGTLSIQPAPGGEVMRSWINPGDYNHVLSHDELDAFQRMYGRQLTFVEVPSSMPADIVVGSHSAAPNNWALGGWEGVWRSSDRSQGIRITAGGFSFNRDSSVPIGFKTKGMNWDYENPSGKTVAAFMLETVGTNNRTPLFRFDGYAPHRFTHYVNTPGGADFKDTLSHVWTAPQSGPIPASELIHVGLELDVWDWTVTSARAVHTDFSTTSTPILSFNEWSQTLTSDDSSLAAIPEGLRMGSLQVPVAHGLRLIAGDAPMNITQFLALPVPQGQLGLADLNRETLDHLLQLPNQVVVDLSDLVMDKLHRDPVFTHLPVAGFGPGVLGAGEDFIIVLDGMQEHLPDDLLEAGNFLMVSHPELLREDRELLVFAQTQLGDVRMGNYALLGTSVIIPEPASLSLLAVASLLLVLRRRAQPPRR